MDNTNIYGGLFLITVINVYSKIPSNIIESKHIYYTFHLNKKAPASAGTLYYLIYFAAAASRIMVAS